MNPQRELEGLLRQHKFRLVSQNKHLKFQNPEGKIVVMAKTPSDWRAVNNQLKILKRVIASPVPTSAVIEEERQRRELEGEIALSAQRKATAGASGGSRGNGTGFTYIDKPAPIKTQEQRDADRLETEWNCLIHRLQRRYRETDRRMADAFYIAQLVGYTVYARKDFVESVRNERRKKADTLRRVTYAVATMMEHITFTPMGLIELWQDGRIEVSGVFQNEFADELDFDGGNLVRDIFLYLFQFNQRRSHWQVPRAAPILSVPVRRALKFWSIDVTIDDDESINELQQEMRRIASKAKEEFGVPHEITREAERLPKTVSYSSPIVRYSTRSSRVKRSPFSVR